jgi:hypothetical protein
MGNREDVALTNYVSRPAAFVGFTHDVYGFTSFQGTSTIDITSIEFRTYFQLFWAVYEEDLIDSFDGAESFSGDFEDPEYLKIYGYWGLHLNDYNAKANWP